MAVRKWLFCLVACSVIANCWVYGDMSVSIRLDRENYDDSNNRVNVTISCSTSVSSRRNNYDYDYDYYGRRRRQQSSRLYEVDRMRILKETESSKWVSVAQVDALDPSTVHQSSAFVTHNPSGAILDNPASYISTLTVTWEGPIAEAIRSFRCDVIYHEKDKQASPKQAHSKKKLDTKDLNNQAFAKLISTEKKLVFDTIKTTITGFNSTAFKIQAEWQSEKNELNARLANLRSRLIDATNAQNIKIDAIIKSFQNLARNAMQRHVKDLNSVESTLDLGLTGSYLMLWPSGAYALPQPASGCPNSSEFSWSTSWVKQQTESTDRNNDDTSKKNHLTKPILHRESGHNFMFQRFCAKTDDEIPGPTWPSGSYCINSVKTSCPAGFSLGSVTWNDEVVDFATETGGEDISIGIYNETSTTQIDYCCRNDGSPELMVDLPRFKPFYMYRMGGQCQRVAGMRDSLEFIYFDTENSNDVDSSVHNSTTSNKGNGLSGLHPDVDVADWNLRIFLCYYANI